MFSFALAYAINNAFFFLQVLEKNHEFILVKKDNEYTKERENFLSTVHVALERFSQLAGTFVRLFCCLKITQCGFVFRAVG